MIRPRLAEYMDEGFYYTGRDKAEEVLIRTIESYINYMYTIRSEDSPSVKTEDAAWMAMDCFMLGYLLGDSSRDVCGYGSLMFDCEVRLVSFLEQMRYAHSLEVSQKKIKPSRRGLSRFKRRDFLLR